MRRKVLQDHANTFCQMLVGWRMGDDLDALAELPDGILSVNVLTGQAVHSVTGALHLGIAGELKAWFGNRLETCGIPTAEIRAAEVSATIGTERIPTNHKKIVSFDFSVKSRIETSDAEYSGELQEMHHWHSRLPSN